MQHATFESLNKNTMKTLSASFPGIGDTRGIIRQARTSRYKAGSKSVHDSLISMIAMTPEEYRNGGEDLTIRYGFLETAFGSMIIAATEKGVCALSFYDGTREGGLHEVRKHFPNATYHEYVDNLHQNAIALFMRYRSTPREIKLHVKGTPFQLKIWQALLGIPAGELATYSAIAEKVNHPKASRAVGSAVGDNPIAFLIPCHRVVRSNGEYGQYHWGSGRKRIMIDREVKGTRYEGRGTKV
jgi:AraC family transcriptional regulator of adaptative response/methylated-DNA-[protein]-cysteine methyltransferase